MLEAPRKHVRVEHLGGLCDVVSFPLWPVVVFNDLSGLLRQLCQLNPI